MLTGISPLISPALLATLAEMGHGDELVLADAHFPGHTLGRRTLRADGCTVDQLVNAILPLLPLDPYAPDPLVMMQVVKGDTPDPKVEADYKKSVARHQPEFKVIKRIDRFAFYDRAAKAYAVVVTGDTRKYGNLIVKKGVVQV